MCMYNMKFGAIVNNNHIHKVNKHSNNSSKTISGWFQTK
jgi:hypothetical protein